MKKQILFLLTIIVLLITQPMNVSASATVVAKPVVTVVKSYPGITTLTVKCSTKGATIYYNLDGKTPTTKSKSVKFGSQFEVDTDDITKVRVIAYANEKYSAVATAPKLVQAAIPTYKVEVTDNGKVKVTITSNVKGAKIYYDFGVSDKLDYTSGGKYVLSGQTIVVDYKDADTFSFRALAGKSYSTITKISLDLEVDYKYLSTIKSIVTKATKNCKTDEGKLMALWQWTMANTDYARTAHQSPDSQYHHPENLIFEGKAVCQGFAYLWEDMAELAGFETEVIINRQMDHAYCVTKVKGSWFYVDTTHEGKKTNTDSSFYYDGFLNNKYASYSKNFHGYNCTSERYKAYDDADNDTTYFELLQYERDSYGYFTYDSKADRYSFTWYEDEVDE